MTLIQATAEAIDFDRFADFTLDHVIAWRNARGDDALDYLHSAAQSYARLIDMRRTGLIDDGTAELVEYLSEPIEDWLACDGDPRFNLPEFLRAYGYATLAHEWRLFLEEWS